MSDKVPKACCKWTLLNRNVVIQLLFDAKSAGKDAESGFPDHVYQGIVNELDGTEPVQANGQLSKPKDVVAVKSEVQKLKAMWKGQHHLANLSGWSFDYEEGRPIPPSMEDFIEKNKISKKIYNFAFLKPNPHYAQLSFIFKGKIATGHNAIIREKRDSLISAQASNKRDCAASFSSDDDKENERPASDTEVEDDSADRKPFAFKNPINKSLSKKHRTSDSLILGTPGGVYPASAGKARSSGPPSGAERKALLQKKVDDAKKTTDLELTEARASIYAKAFGLQQSEDKHSPAQVLTSIKSANLFPDPSKMALVARLITRNPQIGVVFEVLCAGNIRSPDAIKYLTDEMNDCQSASIGAGNIPGFFGVPAPVVTPQVSKACFKLPPIDNSFDFNFARDCGRSNAHPFIFADNSPHHGLANATASSESVFNHIGGSNYQQEEEYEVDYEE